MLSPKHHQLHKRFLNGYFKVEEINFNQEENVFSRLVLIIDFGFVLIYTKDIILNVKKLKNTSKYNKISH